MTTNSFCSHLRTALLKRNMAKSYSDYPEIEINIFMIHIKDFILPGIMNYVLRWIMSGVIRHHLSKVTNYFFLNINNFD